MSERLDEMMKRPEIQVVVDDCHLGDCCRSLECWEKNKWGRRRLSGVNDFDKVMVKLLLYLEELVIEGWKGRSCFNCANFLLGKLVISFNHETCVRVFKRNRKSDFSDSDFYVILKCLYVCLYLVRRDGKKLDFGFNTCDLLINGGF
jgi:hypothetical protein